MNTNPPARMEWAEFKEQMPAANAALLALAQAVAATGLERSLVELVKLRVSQLNGCAFCVQMHAGILRKLGESEERLQLLAVWHEAPVYTLRERAALGWGEALTLIAEARVADDAYETACQQFSARELASLTAAIANINAWNRIAAGLRFTPQLAEKDTAAPSHAHA